MCCTGLKIQQPRNADLRRNYMPPKGFTFSTMTARMQVRTGPGAADPALLDITMTPNENGSWFSIVGSSLVLTIKAADLESLPGVVPVTDPATFAYDILVTDSGGFVNPLVSGPFIVTEGVTR